MLKPELEALRDLESSLGKEALAAAAAEHPQPEDFLPVFQRLERKFPRALARKAVEQAILREKAKQKFDRASRMFFERTALEQASSEVISRHRARRYAGSSLVFDFGCGIGGDSLVLAESQPVISIDLDLQRLALLKMNAAAILPDRSIVPVAMDLRTPGLRFPTGASGFADPARRREGRRFRSPESYSPPLSEIVELAQGLEGLGVKVSPAIEREALEGYPCELEFISLGGDLKEAMLWFGQFRKGRFRASLLPRGDELVDLPDPDLPISKPKTILYAPDPAVLRAGMVRGLGVLLGASQLDPTLAFLTSDTYQPTPFARVFQILEVWPFRLKTLKKVVRERSIGNLTIMKRGSAVDVDSLLSRLRLEGSASGTLVVTRTSGTHIMLLVDPLESRSPEENTDDSKPPRRRVDSG